MMMVSVKHPASGVICKVTPEKAERLGWEIVTEDDAETSEDVAHSEKKPAPRQRGARK